MDGLPPQLDDAPALAMAQGIPSVKTPPLIMVVDPAPDRQVTQQLMTQNSVSLRFTWQVSRPPDRSRRLFRAGPTQGSICLPRHRSPTLPALVLSELVLSYLSCSAGTSEGSWARVLSCMEGP